MGAAFSFLPLRLGKLHMYGLGLARGFLAEKMELQLTVPTQLPSEGHEPKRKNLVQMQAYLVDVPRRAFVLPWHLRVEIMFAQASRLEIASIFRLVTWRFFAQGHPLNHCLNHRSAYVSPIRSLLSSSSWRSCMWTATDQTWHDNG